MERGSGEFGGGREEDVAHNGLGEVFEEGVEDAPRVCVLCLQLAAASDNVCNKGIKSLRSKTKRGHG